MAFDFPLLLDGGHAIMGGIFNQDQFISSREEWQVVMMNALLIDSDVDHLATLERLLRQDGRFTAIHCCAEPDLAWPHLRRIRPEVVFLDARFRKPQDRTGQIASNGPERPDKASNLQAPSGQADGIALAGRIRKNWPAIQLVFISADPGRAFDACQTFPLAFLIKPVRAVQLQQALQRLFITAAPSRNPGVFDGSQPSPIHSTQRLAATGSYALRCLGEFEFADALGQHSSIRMPGRFGRALLAYLISHFDRSVTRPDLMADLMPDRDDDRAVNLLHVQLYKLRRFLDLHARILGGLAIQDHYRLSVPEGVCDLVDFARFVRRPQMVTSGGIEQAEAIAALYRGPCFSSEDFPWADALRSELEVAHEQLLLEIAEYRWAHDEPLLSEQALKTLVRVNPLSEDGHCILLDHYLQRQERRKFLSGFEQYQKIMREELGIPVDHHYQLAYQQLRRT